MPSPIGKDPFTELHLDVIACNKCRLRDGCSQPVGGGGEPKADIVLIGEAPGYTEDKEGVAFVGKSGARLNKWLRLAGIRRRELWLTNVLKCLGPTTLVRLADGSTKRIRDIVRQRYAGEVLTVDPDTGVLGSAKITGWYRSKLAGRRVLKLRFRYGKNTGRGYAGAVLTEDHKVLTQRGFVAARDVLASDLVATGESAPGNSDIEQIILGTMLGDACITKQLRLVHSVKQSAWLGLKASALAGFGGNISQVPQNNAIAFTTTAGAYWRSLRAEFYPDGHKVIPLDRVSRIGPLALAVLYCDDGHLSERCGRQPNSGIATNSFTEFEVRALRDHLRGLGVNAKVRYGAGWRITMGVAATKQFAALIAPYVPPSMRYKLPEQFRNTIFSIESYAPAPCKTFWDTPILEEFQLPRQSVFCIDVEGTHNFVTPGGVVHNCLPTVQVDDGEGNTVRRMRFPSDADYTKGPVDLCLPWLIRELQIVRPRAVVLAGKRALHHVLMRDSLDSANPISPWVGKVLRRRDLYGETRFGVIYHPSFILRNKNPLDESACIGTLKKIANYVKALRAGEPAPPIELKNVRPGKAIQHQQRMTLFGGPHEPAD